MSELAEHLERFLTEAKNFPRKDYTAKEKTEILDALEDFELAGRQIIYSLLEK